MKTLTVCAPHSHAIIFGPKRYENRVWPSKYRGPLMIHAGQSKKWFTEETRAFYSERGFTYGKPVSLPLGVHLGIVWMDESRTIGEVDRLQDSWKECAEGPHCFRLSDPLPFPIPIPAVGLLALWNCAAPWLYHQEPEWKEWMPKLLEWLDRHGLSRDLATILNPS